MPQTVCSLYHTDASHDRYWETRAEANHYGSYRAVGRVYKKKSTKQHAWYENVPRSLVLWPSIHTVVY